MKKFCDFCEDVVKFLESEYDDSYRFEVKRWVAMPCGLIQGNNEKAELSIRYNNHYSLVVVNENMQYLFGWYLTGELCDCILNRIGREEYLDNPIYRNLEINVREGRRR